MHLLLLEDDPLLAATMIDALNDAGFDITHVSDGEAVLDATFEQTFDLYLFDVNVPKMGGFELLKALRDAGDATPAFFITALNDTASLTQGFSVGADDYIKKPFDMEELCIRIRAKVAKKQTHITYGALTFDPQTRALYLDHKPIDLGHISLLIFELLLMHVGQTVDKSAFFDLMQEPSETALRVHMTKLKQRLNISITNIRGIGYRLEK